jgi:hypothetical protein
MLFKPFRFGEGLTLRAVSVRAGIVADPAMSAMVALVDVTAESGGSAHFDCMHDLLLLGAYAFAITLTIGGAMQTKDIGYLKRRPVHSGALDCRFFKTGPARRF